MSKEVDPTQVLPSKEQSAFRSLAKLHEQKQFKKALKTAEGILKVNPNHGETISFKALTLNSTGKKEEALQLGKLALIKTKMKSQISWHVLGLIYRSERNYSEAIKCYRKAIGISESPQILRDLGVLQIQSRDLKGYSETRRQLLMNRSELRGNWVGFCIAHHMCGNHKLALLLLDTILTTMRPNDRETYEQSEIFMYKALLMEESHLYEGTIDFLTTFEDRIVDKTGVQERKARLLLKLARFDEARAIYEDLHKMNPECYDYHRGIQACILENAKIDEMKGCHLPVQEDLVSESKRAEILAYYDSNREKNRNPFSYQRIPLDFLVGEELKARADSYLRFCIRKGIPSLFSTLRPVYKAAFGRRSDSYMSVANENVSRLSKDAAHTRVEVFGKLVQGYIEGLRVNGCFPGGAEKEAPTVLLWCLFFLAQHSDMTGDYDGALKLIDEAIEHTPTLVDLYHVKGRILKHAGDLYGAAEALEKGRTLDLADKWINSKSAKFQLRAGLIEKGESIVALFTKHEGDSRGYLSEMQCMWFEIEAGKAFFKAGNLAMALKFFTNVFKHFEDFIDDQLDFHSYCLRKMTLCSYVGVLRMEDTMMKNRFFAQAAAQAIQCYLHIYDNLEKFRKEDEANVDQDFSNMSGAERKAAKQKAKRAAEKKKKEAEEKEQKAKQNENSKRRSSNDPDADGEKLLETTVSDPLKAAQLLMTKVSKFVSDKLQTHIDSFEVNIRRGKYLLALRAMYKAANVCPEGWKHPEVFSRLVPFVHFVQEGKITYAPWAGRNEDGSAKSMPAEVTLSPVVRTVFDDIVSELGITGDQSALLDSMRSSFSNVSSGIEVQRRLSLCKALMLVHPEKRDDCLKQVIDFPAGIRFETFQQTRDFLVMFNASETVMDEFNKKFVAAFPRSLNGPSATNDEVATVEE